jgi:hypothetical protein
MRRLAALITMLGLPFVSVVQAQSTNASLTGRVTDSSKAAIADAKVTLINKGTNFHFVGATNQTGTYYVAELPAGTYRLEVEKIGFKTVIKPDITLHVQDALEVNFEMAVGSLTESVTVEAGAPTVQLATSSLGAVVNSTTVRELPLNGRSWTDLATLQPGVSSIVTQAPFSAGSDRGVRGFGTQISISGARPQQNNYRLDGVNINDYANGAPGSVLGGNLGVDAIQEFSVLTTNYSTEYGRTSGGVVSAITRSGTNQIHGSVYEFLRNSALDARNFFDGNTIPPFKRNQFGASAGGPIKRDRTFVFGDYEGLRQSKGITQVSVVPSPAARAGNLSTGTVTVDPTVQKFLGLYPLPNAGIEPPGDVGIFSFAGQQVTNENFFTVRVDHKFSQNDTVFTTYMYDNTGFSFPDSFNDVLIGHHTNRQLVALGEEHIFSGNVVNAARLGYSRTGALDLVGVSAINPLATDPSLGAVPGVNAPEVTVGGLSPVFKGGLNTPAHDIYFWNSFQGYDDASFVHGTHSLKFGAAVERIELNYTNFPNPGGQFTFGSLADFLTNGPSRVKIGLPGQLNPQGIRQTVFGVYVQDDWRWRPSVTLNLGLRYEMASVPSEVHNRLSNLYNLTDTTPHLGSPYFQNPTLHNFEPRVGFAWDPLRNGKTAVRGGFGIFDVLPLPYEFLLYSSATPFAFVASANNLPPGAFINGILPFLGPSSSIANHIDEFPKRNYVMQWNLNIQRELTPNLTAMVGYVGSHGVHQPFKAEDMDIVLPTLTSAGYLFPSPIGSGTRVNPNFGAIQGTMYGSSSSYNALEVGVEKRMSHGIQLQGSFTWGKSIDTGSATEVGDAFANGIASPQWFNLKLNRGLSDFNIGRTLILNGTWQVPQLRSLAGPAAWVVNGWQLGAIFKVNDGVPFTATFGTDGDPQGLNSSDPWAFPNRLGGPGCQTLTNPGNPNNYIKTECFAVPTAPSAAFYNANCDPTVGTAPQCFNLRGNAGRNILIGPGVTNLDFSLFKNNHIKRVSENFNVQFRAEIFNILNHANFSVPVSPDNTDIFDSTGAPTGVAGLLTSTTTTAREIQFALKFIW